MGGRTVALLVPPHAALAQLGLLHRELPPAPAHNLAISATKDEGQARQAEPVQWHGRSLGVVARRCKRRGRGTVAGGLLELVEQRPALYVRRSDLVRTVSSRWRRRWRGGGRCTRWRRRRKCRLRLRLWLRLGLGLRRLDRAAIGESRRRAGELLALLRFLRLHLPPPLTELDGTLLPPRGLASPTRLYAHGGTRLLHVPRLSSPLEHTFRLGHRTRARSGRGGCRSRSPGGSRRSRRGLQTLDSWRRSAQAFHIRGSSSLAAPRRV